MLEGLRKDTGERIKLWAMNATAVSGLIAEIENEREIITCHNPKCGCSMYVRALDSKNIVTHFARFPKTGNEQCHPGKGESLEHQLAKQRLALWLQQSYPTAEITTEFSIDNQRIDVYVKHSDGRTEAHEIQRTPQTTFRTQSRTNGYKAKGIENVVWWWLDRGNEERNRNWCADNTEQFGTAASVYDEIMGQRILSDIKFTRYNSADIKAEKRRKHEERMRKLEEQAATPAYARQAPAAEDESRRTAQDLLLAQRRANMSRVGQSYPTQFPGGSVTVASYNPATDRYTGASGLTWRLVDGVMRVPEECQV
jgi:competence CoiA-like predicted nuclease